nr:MAG TPA: hypothetical protein [Caudoviricetes sp.]
MEGSVEDVTPHFFFPPRSKPLFISPEPLSYYIYAEGLKIYYFFKDQSIKICRITYNIGSVCSIQNLLNHTIDKI